MDIKESSIMKRIQVAASSVGARLFRNNIGRLQDATGRYVQFGLGVGTSDLIGYKTKEITADMVGKRVAIFTAIEVKKPGGKPTEMQENFLRAVNKDGGIAFLSYSEDDAIKYLTI